MERFAAVLSSAFGIEVPMPGGAFYLWPQVDDAWGFAERLAAEGGALVSPGDFYGPAGAGFVRVALVQPMDRLELVASRLGV
jgi:aspartate/methionine/tyrosine aminotransferase